MFTFLLGRVWSQYGTHQWPCSYVPLTAFIILVTTASPTTHQFRGRYSLTARTHEALLPRKVDEDGSFLSFELPHFYNSDAARTRREAPAEEEPARVRYALPLAGLHHVIELWPNRGFLSPGLVVERRRRDVRHAVIRRVRREKCHYVGRVRGHAGSRVVLSACLDGLAGLVRTRDDQYLIEPAADHFPDGSGRHLHVVSGGDAKNNRRRRESGGIASYCGVNNDWRRAWEDRFAWELEVNPDIQRLRSSSTDPTGTPHYVQTLVVADKTFLDFHNSHDPESYIMTLMNMASDYFHDATVGRPVDIAVVRILFLEKEDEELSLTISSDARKTLESFNKWAQHINPKDSSHPNHHDMAILLTRHDLCAGNGTDCGVLGLATAAAMCRPGDAAAVVEDTGLQTGLTIAHEIGHALGCAHDGGAACAAETEGGAAFVMAPLPAGTGAAAGWSRCSRKLLARLLDSRLAACLLDEPRAQPFQGVDMPPGAMYDAAYQCRASLGLPDACPTAREEVCRALWCKAAAAAASGACVSARGAAAAAGTRCGEGRWCFAGACVQAGRRPGAEDGAWGAWGAWSPCSRSCGGGVEAQRRLCARPPPRRGGRFCAGEARRFRVCNAEPCDPARPSFRQVQCAAFDRTPFQGQLRSWRAVEAGEGEGAGPCALVCEAAGGVRARLAAQARDGSPCRRGARDRCAGGRCERVGCDWVLRSDAREDECGRCGGDGAHCARHEQVFRARTGNRYVRIADVPPLSYNVRVEELEPSVNTIAVSDAAGATFFLNENFQEQADGEYRFGAGVAGVYAHPEAEREVLLIRGPTAQALAVHVVFYGQPNPGVRVAYYLRTDAASDNASYAWQFVEWEPCTRRCQGGVQVARASCVEARAGVVSASFCDAAARPQPHARPCNLQACRARWRWGAWGACDACEGRPGQRRRAVQCLAESPLPAGGLTPVPDARCAGPRPPDAQPCLGRRPCETARVVESTNGYSTKDSQSPMSAPAEDSDTEATRNVAEEVTTPAQSSLHTEHQASTEKTSESAKSLKSYFSSSTTPSEHTRSTLDTSTHRSTSLQTSPVSRSPHNTSVTQKTTPLNFSSKSIPLLKYSTESVSASTVTCKSVNCKFNNIIHLVIKNNRTLVSLANTMAAHPSHQLTSTPTLATTRHRTFISASEGKGKEDIANQRIKSPLILERRDVQNIITSSTTIRTSTSTSISSTDPTYTFLSTISSTEISEALSNNETAGAMDNETIEDDMQTSSGVRESVVVDALPPDLPVLLEAPLIASNSKISEKSEQEMGDSLNGMLDTRQETMYRGKSAVDKIKEIRKQQDV